MICYRDKTFCSASCANRDCTIRLTPEVYKAAKKWWGKASGDAPIAFTDYSKTCPAFVLNK